MAKTVNAAFDEFLSQKVNLETGETDRARKSRDWLVEKINEFPNKDGNFPTLYNVKNIFFGSFARSTKIRPLDDIDIIVCLSAQGSTYTEYSDRIELNVPESAMTLNGLCDFGTNKLNSRKVINKFISSLNQIPQYKNAEISRNLEAATLNLSSYTWAFDIVPSFFTAEDIYKKTYYLIPDGKGNWKKTDPRIDRDRVKTINQGHDGNVLNVIRIIKYWNKRPTMPTMPSYLLENMILNYYEQQTNKTSNYVDIEIPDVLSHINRQIQLPFIDPKGIQGDINTLSKVERDKIQGRSYTDYYKAIDARTFESNGDHKSSINKWIEIFGVDFPKYD